MREKIFGLSAKMARGQDKKKPADVAYGDGGLHPFMSPLCSSLTWSAVTDVGALVRYSSLGRT